MKHFPDPISDFDAVGEFHTKFDLPVAGPISPRLLDPGATAYRQKFMREELDEYAHAHQQKDLVGVADALVDLAYVVLGTAHYHGLPWKKLFEVVHAANMAKARGDGHRRGPAEKIIKPPGWRAPDLAPIIQAAGWTDFQPK